MADAKGGKKDEKKEEPKFDFEAIAKDLARMDEKQHIDQIEAALSDVYMKHSKFTDDKGVVRFKKKFNKDEATKLGNDLYDALGYHSHRRVFGMGEEQYKTLKAYKDPNGVPYLDAIVQHHYQIDRKGLVRTLAREDKDNRITHQDLQKLLEKPIQNHAGLMRQGLLAKHDLTDPKHMGAVKKAIDGIVDRYQLSKKVYDTGKMHDYNQVINVFENLAAQHYHEHAHEEKKKAA